MHIILSNKISIICDNQEWLDIEPKLNPYIVVENKAYIQKMNLGISTKNELKEYSLADINIQSNKIELILPIGLWDFIKHLLPQPIDQRKNQHVSIDLISKYSILLPYQKNAVAGMLPNNNGILKSPPGSGKTLMGLTLGKLKGKSLLWINDRIDLCKQAMEKAINLLGFPPEQCGLLQGDNENIKPYTFTTIQKLHKVLNKGFNDITQSLIHFDTIIIDECHHAVGSYNDYKQYFQALNELNYKHVYGLTATNKRVDGNEHLVYAIIGPVRYEVKESTRIMKAKVHNKNCNINTSEEIYETFVNKYTQKAMPASVDNYLIFHETYTEFCKPIIQETIKNYNKILIVSPRVSGAQYWSNYLESLGIEHFLVYGAIKKRERLYTSKIIVATLDLVKEGFDVPDLEAVIITGRKPHKYVAEQIVGRVERYLEGKKDPVAYFLSPKIVRNERKVSFQNLKENDWL